MVDLHLLDQKYTDLRSHFIMSILRSLHHFHSTERNPSGISKLTREKYYMETSIWTSSLISLNSYVW